MTKWCVSDDAVRICSGIKELSVRSSVMENGFSWSHHIAETTYTGRFSDEQYGLARRLADVLNEIEAQKG